MFRKWICKIFKLVPKEDYDAVLKAKSEVIVNQSAEIIEANGKIVAQNSKIAQLARDNAELTRTLEKCHATPCEFVGISYSSLFPKSYTEEMLREAAWNKICDKVKNNGVQYDFRDGECVATLSVLK